MNNWKEEDVSFKNCVKVTAILLIVSVAIWLSTMLASCTACNAQPNIPENELAVNPTYAEAYKDLLYRIWIDKPNYVEDVLSETDEWIDLTSKINLDDVFQFRCKEDSVRYQYNWYNGDGEWEEDLSIPDYTRSKLIKAFGSNMYCE